MFLWRRRMQFRRPAWTKFDGKPTKFPSMSKKMYKHIFSIKKTLLKILLWTHKMQFSQPCRKVFPWRAKVFCSFTKTIRTLMFLKKQYFSSKGFYGLVEFSFDNAAGNLLKKTGKFRSKKKMIKNIHSFQNKIFSKIFLGTREMRLLQTINVCALSNNNKKNENSPEFISTDT